MFIYVMKREDADTLVAKGFELLKADEKNNLWIFANDAKLNFDSDGMDAVVSDTLTF